MKSIAFCFLLTVPVALAEAFTLAPNSVGSRRTMSSPRSTTTTSLSICKAQATNDDNAAFDRLRGGDSSSTPFYSEVVNQQELSSSQKAVAALTSFWGTGGMVYILAKAIKRVVPIALEPFAKESSLVLTPFQWRYVALMYNGIVRQLLVNVIVSIQCSRFVHFSQLPTYTYSIIFDDTTISILKRLCSDLSFLCLLRRIQGISNQILAPRRQAITLPGARHTSIWTNQYPLRPTILYGTDQCY